MQPPLFEKAQHPPESGAAAVFEQVLDVAAASGDRRQADDLRDQIVLGLGVTISDAAFAAFLIIQDETDGDARSAGPVGERSPTPIASQVPVGVGHDCATPNPTSCLS